jgi:hypothetical protein
MSQDTLLKESSDTQQKQGFSLFAIASRPALGPTRPPVQWVLVQGVKRPGREADHSLPCNAEVKNAWSYMCSSQKVFLVWYLVKNKSNFTLLTSEHLRYKIVENSDKS